MRHKITQKSQTFSVADLFCGAGGSSTGARMAISEMGGDMDLMAVNHWDTAIASHSANHPDARHYVEDVSIVDPEVIVPGGYLDLLMASPECRFYSRARGGKPIHDQGRMNPWAIHRWLTAINVRCVLIENVPEFIEWGPLDEDFKPDRSKKGLYFQSWLRTFWDTGYQAEWRMLNAADYGDVTTRTRFFLQARRDGKPIQWPEPSHAKGDTGMFKGRKRWRPARDIIDWNDHGRSLLDDPKYAKRPLSPKTRARIARGLERFGGPLAPLYIRLLGLEPEGDGKGAQVAPFHNSDRQHSVARSVDDPIHTVTTLTGGGSYLVKPEVIRLIGANRNHNVPKSADEPIPPATTTPGGGGVFMVEATQQSAFLLGQQSGGAPRSADEPVPTVATDGAISLVEPVVTIAKGESMARGVDDPLPTVTGMRHLGIAEPVIAQYHGQSGAHSVDEPLGSPTTHDRFALAQPMAVPYGPKAEARTVEEPLPTIMTKDRLGLAEPVLMEVAHAEGGDRTAPIDDPLKTITTHRTTGLAMPLADPILLDVAHGDPSGPHITSTGEPLPTVTATNTQAVVNPQAEPFLVPQFGEAPGQEPRVHDVREPLPAVTSHGAGALVEPTIGVVEPVLQAVTEAGVDPDRVVLIDGQPYILDIRFRMLRNGELARAMGFSDEEGAYEFHGTVAEVTKQIGNAVPVHVAAALVKAVLA